jgi:hypothetical protein
MQADPPSIPVIQALVCTRLRVTERELLVDRSALAEAARRLTIWLADWQWHDWLEIADHLGRRVVTVANTIARLDRLIETDPAFADRMVGFMRAVDGDSAIADVIVGAPDHGIAPATHEADAAQARPFLADAA